MAGLVCVLVGNLTLTDHSSLFKPITLAHLFSVRWLDGPSRSGKSVITINTANSIDVPPGTDPGSITFKRNPSDGDTITVSTSDRVGVPMATTTIFLTVDGIKHDALDLAAQCIKDWDAFLQVQGIQFEK